VTRFAGVLGAEAVKLRRSWALLVALLAPLVQAGFLLIVVWFSDDRARQVGTGFQAWYQVNFNGWGHLFLPITAALCASLVWSQEAEASAWKHLQAQPVPWRHHLLAKLGAVLLLVLLAQALLMAALALGGLVLRAFVPALGMGAFEAGRLLRYGAMSLLAGLPLLVLHGLLGARMPQGAAALAVALGGTWISTRLPETGWACLWPWGLATRLAHYGHGPEAAFPLAAWGALGIAGLLLAVGLVLVRRPSESGL